MSYRESRDIGMRSLAIDVQGFHSSYIKNDVLVFGVKLFNFATHGITV